MATAQERSVELAFGEKTKIPRDQPWERFTRAVESLRDGTGIAHIPNVLSPEITEALALEADGHLFEDHSGPYGLAEQRVKNLAIPFPYEGFPTVRSVGMLLDWNARYHRTNSIERQFEYRPTEAKYNLYPPGEVGITPHRDHADDWFIVAAFTLRGEADFSVRELPPAGETPEETVAARREAPIIESWHTCPGDLVVLRATGFNMVKDSRPLHEVTGGNSGESRLSLVYRQITGLSFRG